MKIGFDIDGVIAFPRYKWWSEATEEQVIELIGTCKPNQSVIDYVNTLFQKHEIFLVTGRFELNRVHTEDWLEKHGVMYHKLLMNTYNDLEKYYQDKIEHINREGIQVFYDDNFKMICKVNEKTDCVGYLYKEGTQLIME